MQKFSRSKSLDPKQEALRQTKDNWNSETSEFIGDLIDFKRALNGKEVPSRGIPKTRLKDPMPQEVEALLSELSENALRVIQHAKTVIDEQDNYSQIRNKSKISSKEEEIIKLAELISESSIFGKSWSGGRLWAKIKLLLSDDKKFSADILDGCHELINNLKNLENLCLSGNDEDAPKVFTAIQVCAHIFNNRILVNINKQLTLQEESAKEIAQNLPKAKQSKPESTEEDHSIEADLDEDSKIPDLEKHRDSVQNKDFIYNSLSSLEDTIAGIIYEQIEHIEGSYSLFTKLFNDIEDIEDINTLADADKDFRNALKKGVPVYEKLFEYKKNPKNPKNISFTRKDLDYFHALYSKYDRLLKFYKSKIFSDLESKNITKFSQILHRLQEIEDSVEEDSNALMISEAGSISDIKNFIRKKWLNLKLDLGSANSIEKYIKEILDASKSARKYIEKMLVLIEDKSVNLNIKNVKNMVLNQEFKSSLPLDNLLKEITPSYEFMMQLLKISVIYADLYKQNIRREKLKETRYYYSISASDLKEHKLLMEQMANLYNSIRPHINE